MDPDMSTSSQQQQQLKHQHQQQQQEDENELRNYNSILSLMTAGKGRQLANDLVDDLLKSIGPKIKLVGLDPLKLPERSVEFQKQVCCKTYPGVAELKSGVCRGIADARRHGEIGINITDSIEITFVVRIGPVSVTYESDVTLRNHVFHPRLIATSEFLDVLIDMAFNAKTMALDLRSLKITEAAPVVVKVENMSIFLRFLVKPVVKHMIDSESKFFISKVNMDFKENIKALTQNAQNIKRWIPSLLSGVMGGGKDKEKSTEVDSS